jgi:hypothetical protein
MVAIMKAVPAPQPATVADQPTSSVPLQPEVHSVLVLNRDPVSAKKRIFRMPVEPDGSYRQLPVSLAEGDVRSRLVARVAGEALPYDARPPDDQQFSAFGILPIKPEPSSSHGDCYLINADRLQPTNSWTIDPWNTPPNVDVKRVTAQKLLVATSDGVFVATLGNSPIDLKKNAAVWQMLRNGCVVGCVPSTAAPEPLPLVNLASFSLRNGSAAKPPITGTLDFKWPKGSTIRVKLLRPSALDDATWAKLSEKVQRLARSWLLGVPLEFEFGNDDGYDALVDMSPLDPPRQRRDELVDLPLADLGVYCQRRPLNEPTMFVGEPKGLKFAAPQVHQIDGAYYDSAAFDHIVLHEFGHLLGLPHLHQHPAWKGKIFAGGASGLIDTIKAQMGITVDESYVASHLQAPWPGQEQDFSEWPDVSETMSGETLNREKLAAFFEHSVMMGLPISRLSSLDTRRDVGLSYKSEPGSKDIEWLKQLYQP